MIIKALFVSDPSAESEAIDALKIVCRHGYFITERFAKTLFKNKHCHDIDILLQYATLLQGENDYML